MHECTLNDTRVRELLGYVRANPRCVSLVAGLFALMLVAMPTMSHAADENGPFYMEMDTITVQFEHKTCKRTIMALSLLIEYTQADKLQQINAYRPKLKSLLFAALDDHLAEAKTAKRTRVQRIAKKVVQKALGKRLISDVLVTQMMLQK